MADYYCDHGAYGLATNRIGLDAPVTWAVPQEGDGSASGAAAASGVASIKFNAVPTSGAYTLCGASVSVTGVLSAASAAAAATALAANINATTATVSASAAVGTPQLRNLVFARVNPGDSAEVQIMMRVGSTSLNHATNSNVAQVHTFNGTAPTVVQFIGGTGGCWGWFWNSAALGVSSSIAVLTYGAGFALPMAGVIPTRADNVWCRTGGGASKTIAITLGSSTVTTHGVFGTNLRFDTNTIWTGDSPTGTLKLSFTATTWGTSHRLASTSASANYPKAYDALRRGGFEIEFNATLGAATRLDIYPSTGSAQSSEHWRNVVFRDNGTLSGGFSNWLNPWLHSGSNGGNISRIWERCDYIVTTPRASLFFKPFTIPFAVPSNYRCIGCTFDFNISGVSNPGDLVDGTQVSDVQWEFIGCEFKGFAGGYRMWTSLGGTWPGSLTQFKLVMEGCSGLQLPGSYSGWPVNTMHNRADVHAVVQSNITDTANPGYRYEDTRGVVEWVPADAVAFPTLASTIVGSGDPYSLRLIWLQTVLMDRTRPFTAPQMRMWTQLAEDERTLALQLFVPTGVTQDVRAVFSYTDDNGIVRTEETETLASSSATWANAGLYAGYAAKKLEVTTAYPVAANSEVTCSLSVCGMAPSSVTNLYYDPEFSVT